MATHSSTFAWKIPWKEEPGELQSMGSQRVGHDRTTSCTLSSLHRFFVSLFFCHVLTFWHYKMIQVLLVYFLAQFQNQSFLFGALVAFIGIRNQDLGIRCSCCYRILIATKLSQLTEQGDIRMYMSSYICSTLYNVQGFPGHLVVKKKKKSTCQCRRCRFIYWVRKIPQTRKWQPAPGFLPGKFHGQRSLVGYSPLGCEELDTTE